MILWPPTHLGQPCDRSLITRQVGQLVGWLVVLGLCRFSWCWCWCRTHTLGLQLCQAQLFTLSPDLYSDSMYANVFAGSSPRILLLKRPLLPHLDVGLSMFSRSTLSAGFPICNLDYFMIIWHFSDLFLPFYAFHSCFLCFRRLPLFYLLFSV